MPVYSADIVIEAIDDYYDDLLGREPTDGEVRLYLAGYRTNPSLEGIRSGIAGSTEARNALAAVFRDVLERDADPDRLNQLQQLLVDGASLDDVREELEGFIVLPEEPSGPDQEPTGPEPGDEEPPGPDEPQPSPDEVRDAVNGLYQDVLGRDADGAGLDFWQQAVGNGLPLANVRAALAYSPEARLAVGSLYADVLGREGDDGGLGFFQRSVAGDDAGLDDVQAALAGSDEARATLDGLYQDVLGREGDAAGLDFWQRQLAAGGASLDGIRAAVAGSGEARLAVNRLYEEVLGRDGDDAGLEYWQGTLAGGDVELDDIRALLAGSAEAEEVTTIQASSTSMAFLAPTEMPAPMAATSGAEISIMAGQTDWRLPASSPFDAPGPPMIFSASGPALGSAPLLPAANAPSFLAGLPDPLHVGSPVVG